MKNHPERWRDRLAAHGCRPESFLVMGRLFCHLVDRMTPELVASAGETLKQGPFATVDWDQAYRTAPRVLFQIGASLDPGLPGEVPADEGALGPWLRDTFERVEATVTKLEKRLDPATGFLTDEAMQTPELKALLAAVEQQADPLLVELKAVADNLAALMNYRKPMGHWITAAATGDTQALLVILSMNPWLTYHPGITRRIQQAMADKDHELLHRIAQVMKRKPILKKHGTVGVILFVLWEAGLKRLTYKQIRGFLKAVGLHGVPNHQALERYGQRLGLKKYVIEGEAARRARA